jgi:hypothetical protein
MPPKRLTGLGMTGFHLTQLPRHPPTRSLFFTGTLILERFFPKDKKKGGFRKKSPARGFF